MPEPVKLSDAQRRMMLILDDEGAGPGYLGEKLWGNGYRSPQSYARPAGSVLRALERKGLAQWGAGQSESHRWGWRLTVAGKRWRKLEGGDL